MIFKQNKLYLYKQEPLIHYNNLIDLKMEVFIPGVSFDVEIMKITFISH